MNLNEKLKNYLTHEENDFLKVENSYNKKTSYLVGFEFASGSTEYLKVKQIAQILEEKMKWRWMLMQSSNQVFNHKCQS